MENRSDLVRLSLRLITAGRLIERRIDQMMRADFSSSISRFDFLSALDRHGPLSLGEVSAYLLVSNGNVTGLAARLRTDGLIESLASSADRRLQIVRLTQAGQSAFTKMAKAHRACVETLLGEVARNDRSALVELLDRAKASVRRAAEMEAAP